jgi:hypothetical protein
LIFRVTLERVIFPSMTLTYHPTDHPRDDTLLIRWHGRDVGYINRPPALYGLYRAYTAAGEELPGEHSLRMNAALTCVAWAERGQLHWSCGGDAALLAIDRHERQRR